MLLLFFIGLIFSAPYNGCNENEIVFETFESVILTESVTTETFESVTTETFESVILTETVTSETVTTETETVTTETAIPSETFESVTTETAIPSETQTTFPSETVIPITSGDSAVITYFTDTVFQCISGQPSGNALAVNPLLLGFTESDWNNLYVDADSSVIPWCGKTITIIVNGQSFSGEIIDTCDPTGNQFTDPNTGELIGGRCDYNNALDLYGQPGLDFLNKITNGNDFYDGNLTWTIQ